MKFLEFLIFLLFVFIFIAVFSAFTHKSPQEYGEAVIPNIVITEAYSIAEPTDNIAADANLKGLCAKKDKEDKRVSVWQCRKYLWR